MTTMTRRLIKAHKRRSRTSEPASEHRTPRRASRRADFDIVIMSDLRYGGDASLRLTHEIRIQSRAGYRTGLIHLPTSGIKRQTVHPEANACVREGLATVLDPHGHTPIATRLLVIHAPHLLFQQDALHLPPLLALKIVIVVDRPPEGHYETAQVDQVLRDRFGGSVLWAPINRRLRDLLSSGNPGITIEKHDWTPSVLVNARPSRESGIGPVIGRVATSETSQWPAHGAALYGAYPDDGSAHVRILAVSGAAKLPSGLVPPAWEISKLDETSIGKFLGHLDFFAFYPRDESVEVPDVTIAEAMARGAIPLLPPWLAARYGKGALGCEARDAAAFARRLSTRPAERKALVQRSIQSAQRMFGPFVHLRRIARLLNEAPVRKDIQSSRTGTPRVLFMTSNGVGLGHLTRLLAVARRLPDGIEPVFATMSQAYGIVEQFGYAAEYIPYHQYAECNIGDWQVWLAQQLRQVIEHFGIRAVVFDGSNPYTGLLREVGPRSDVSLVWIRRAMWKARQQNDDFIARQRFFDLIIEPGDIAESRDAGATVEHRDRTRRVNPIRLLDNGELLTRRAAAAELGLDTTRPVVLVQLGGGATRDILTVTDSILGVCAEFRELQVVMVEWAITSRPLRLWPGVKLLRGFPVARYFRAFDFAISAAGYNSYHELLCTGVPAIFVPDENMMLDDQVARAAHAAAAGAACALAPFDADRLRLAISTLMDQGERAGFVDNCRRLALPNGAAEAASTIANQVLGHATERTKTFGKQAAPKTPRASRKPASANHDARATLAGILVGGGR